ncbi:MAG: hypothetical protein KatS3mg102_0331 [Planctomycetota bacterium]|nr:MAG: hypothetical protein KatS3mg102_0331 [Planctomycetota bacterium]
MGVGRGASLASLQARYCKEPVSLDPSEEGVWIIPPFTPEPAKAPGARRPPELASAQAKQVSQAGREPAPLRAGVQGRPWKRGPGVEGTVRRVVGRGAVPVENRGELFRCFVGPAARMNLMRLGSGVHFELVLPEDRPMSENDPALEAMQEAARQLGLQLDIEG